MVRTSRLKTLLLLALALTALGSATLAVLWQRGVVQRWISGRVVDEYVRRIQPHLPFTIEEAHIEGSWAALRGGRISRLAVTLRWQDFRARLSGPILLEGDEHDFSAEYQPEATLERVGTPGRSPPLKLEIEASVSKTFTRLVGLRLQIEAADRFDWAPLHIRSKHPLVEAVWNRGGELEAVVRADSLELALGGTQLSATALDFEAHAPAELKPFSIGPNASLDLDARGLELLVGDRYFDLPLAQIPIEANFEGHVDASGADLRAVNVSLAHGGVTLGVARVDSAETTRGAGATSASGAATNTASGAGTAPAPPAARDPGSAYRVRWQTRALELGPLIKGVVAATASAGAPFASLARLGEVQVAAGRFRTGGTLTLARGADGALEPRAWDASARVRGLDARDAKLALAIHGAELDLTRVARDRIAGTIAIARAGYRHARGKVAAIPFRATPVAAAGHVAGSARAMREWSFRLGREGDAPLPISIEGLPLEIKPLTGHWGADPGATTALKLASTELGAVLKMLCVRADRAPPARLTAELDPVELSPGDIDPTGFVEARLFDGLIHVDQIGLFDLGSEVPEFDFTAALSGVRLDRIGDWLGFGEMDGILQGYAKDVTFQSWLPTHFDFKLEAKPLNRWKVVFSPDAMRNVVKLFAGEGLDELPGIANWLAFGWPSRVFGGYDVFYAGASIFSSEGTMLLETLDPRPDGEHFLLYGPRFRIPLKSSRYPLVMDATSMGNFIRQMAIQFENLAREKAARAGPKPPEDPDHAQCQPD